MGAKDGRVYSNEAYARASAVPEDDIEEAMREGSHDYFPDVKDHQLGSVGYDPVG